MYSSGEDESRCKRGTLAPIILGLSLVGGVALFIGGCTLAEVWWSIFALVPAIAGLICQYGMTTTSDPSMEAGCISFDTWVFLLVVCITSTFALPIMLSHTFSYPNGALACFICAAALVLAGYLLFSFLSRDPSGNE
jgi:hypothetical protein